MDERRVDSPELPLPDADELFQQFRKTYPGNAQIQSQKRQLKALYSEAKTLGESVNKYRSRINRIKSQIEAHRIEQAVSTLQEKKNPLLTLCRPASILTTLCSWSRRKSPKWTKRKCFCVRSSSRKSPNTRRLWPTSRL
eukprot:m.169301 g.169301  ORF g.169301 m.169301 type:complete len:139 (-) comp10364_c1_seq3:467-883(-)